MNLRKQYHQIVNRILTDYLNVPRQYQNVESKLIKSEDANDYIIFVYGTHDTESIHECVLHVQIEDDKIIVRRDSTKCNLFDKLLDAKVPSDKIIYPDAPQRKITDYSVSLEKIYELHGSLFEVKENFTKALKQDIPSAELLKLAAIKHEYLNCAIASHPNTSPDLLTDFFPKFPLQVLTNPILDLLLLEQPRFIEKLYDTYSYFFERNEVKDIKEVRKWAEEKKQEDVDLNTCISNIKPTFILTKTISDRQHYIIQNLWKNECFLGENQGVWNCVTELEGYDPPVWILGYRGDTWEYLCDSLTEFLVTFCLQETLSRSNLRETTRYQKEKKYKYTFIWQGKYAWDIVFGIEDGNRNGSSFYYLVEDYV